MKANFHTMATPKAAVDKLLVYKYSLKNEFSLPDPQREQTCQSCSPVLMGQSVRAVGGGGEGPALPLIKDSC